MEFALQIVFQHFRFCCK